MPRKSQGILSRESPQTERFHTAWARCGRAETMIDGLAGGT